MANFNIDFGQKAIENRQNARRLDLQAQQIAASRDAAAASAAAQGSSAFWNRVAQRDANELRAKELALREERQNAELAKQNAELSWNDALKEQELAERKARLEQFNAQREKYEIALDEDRRQAEENKRQAEERGKLLNSELAALYLAARRNGGTVSPSMLKAFNDATAGEGGMGLDVAGNSIDIGNGRHKLIGDGSEFFLGQYKRDGKGNVVRGADGTPEFAMLQKMPKELRGLIEKTAYGDTFIGKQSGAEMSPERLELEKERLRLRGEEEKGRNARAGTKNEAANARLAASVAKNMTDIKRGLKLTDDQASQFQASLTKILSDALGGEEEQPFKELSREEYSALSPEEQQRYRETWKNWRAKQAK